MRRQRMQEKRIQRLNDRPARDGSYVLYWMQRSQRAEGNLALDYAIDRANDLDLPVLTVFALIEGYPDANERHFAFMLEGLDDVARKLAERGVGFVVRPGSPPDPVVELARDASLVICDRGYLRHLRAWREELARASDAAVVQVEDNTVIPADLVSAKREYAARTIRPKLHGHLDEFLNPSASVKVRRRWKDLNGITSCTRFDARDRLSDMKISGEATPVSAFSGGRLEAVRRLEAFVRDRLPGYAEKRSDPALDATSNLSPYLHFGHIGPAEIARRVLESDRGTDRDREVLVEELVVRRELAVNYVLNEPRYDDYGALPDWARKTLADHRRDERPYLYGVDRLEAADTHDPYWNAAMSEMLKTGFMHNYMRMYWGKKILEWTQDPEEAFYAAIYLNNKYFLDGRDPNSYAGVGWIFGLHDRPWKERPIFGKVRYMNANGLERKFDVEAYVRRVGEM